MRPEGRCARTKLRQLKEENQLEIRQKKAQKQREEKQRGELEQELKERRRKRMAREHAQIFQRLSDWPACRKGMTAMGLRKRSWQSLKDFQVWEAGYNSFCGPQIQCRYIRGPGVLSGSTIADSLFIFPYLLRKCADI